MGNSVAVCGGFSASGERSPSDILVQLLELMDFFEELYASSSPNGQLFERGINALGIGG